MKILIPQDIADAGKEYLEKKGYEYIVCENQDEETLIKEVKECDGILIRTAPVTRKVMEAGKKLKVIAKHGVGVDNIDVDTATKLGIQVTNGPESNFESVAEHTVAFIMAMAHHITEMDANVREGRWETRNQVRMTDLKGKTAGLIGLGKIGLSVAKKLALGLDMNVIGYDAYMPKDAAPAYIEQVDSIEQVYRNSDFVSLHCPLTAETRNSVDMKFLSMMKPSAFFINTARGEIVNEKDLCRALETGIIQGAALDVFDGEPLCMNNPLLQLKNTIFSPHCGAHSFESFDSMAVHAAMGIDQVLSGKEVRWKVNHIREETRNIRVKGSERHL